MTGRIRSIKPEWLEDELMMGCSACARVLSIGLILLADDYGNGRAHPALLRSRTLPLSTPSEFAAAMDELVEIRFVSIYDVDGQRYFSIRNWAKHQRVDKPGKPRVPAPEESASSAPKEKEKVAYFVRGSSTGLIKIGASIDPVARVVELSKAASESFDLLAVGGVEREHHAALAADRVHGEWFSPSEAVMRRIRDYGGNPEKPLATVGYKGSQRFVEQHAADAAREVPGKVPGVPAPDLDLDLDLDQDQVSFLRNSPSGVAVGVAPDDGAIEVTGIRLTPEAAYKTSSLAGHPDARAPSQTSILGPLASPESTSSEQPEKPSAEVAGVFEYWRETMGKRQSAKLDAKRTRLIKSALKSHGVDVVRAAIVGCSKSAFHMGQNDRGERYDDLTLILRDASKIESFAAKAEGAAISRGFAPPAAEDEFEETVITPGFFIKGGPADEQDKSR